MISVAALSGTLANRLGPHGKRAMTLVGGTSAAQLIPLAIAPFLTRLYSPEEYGVLAIFGSISAILAAVAAGRYTVAIMLPESDRDAVQVTGLALFIAASVSALLLVLTPVALSLIGGVNMIQKLGAWLYLVPVAVFLGSMFESLGYFSLRKDKVSQIARANVMKTAISGGSQVSLGLLGVGLPGLMWGGLLGLASGNIRLIRIYMDGLRAHPLHWPQIKAMAQRYSNFPKYDLWGNLANSLAYNLITIGVGAIYSYHALGQYALAFRSASMPLAILSVALGQVYLREAARRVNSPALALRAFYRAGALLIAVSVIPMVVVGLWGGTLFSFVFGAEWHLAGVYAAAMTPLLWARFVSSPLSSVFYIYGKQATLLIFQTILLAVIVLTMTASFELTWSLRELLLVQSSLMGSFYVVLLYFARRTIVHSGRRSETGSSADRTP